MERLVKTSAVALIIFATVLAFVIGSRMEQSTIVLLSGAAVGILLCAPSAAILTYSAMRRRDANAAVREVRVPRFTTPLPTETPAYWAMPQMPYVIDPRRMSQGLMPGTSYGAMDPNYQLPARRRFYVIGEGGEASEVGEEG
ncbi:MAG: hypothetical protein K1X39_12500 [Thermoflexales bacterium]|nr:hypothetical protein [Thermoflexales bacterium]